ncbi:GrpB family protein [Pedobacter aquatilis]|uniref:GrpB family protein n=1 Tax=Pedobacter aquatilis TaxID=351343 RepID=UPI00292DB182|nr:GrpB family protein [Pedobacter aquatilis]
MLIVAYRKSWPLDFSKIENELLQALSGLEITIEHIGSTAVPNLAAKPIIDIDIVFNKTVKLEQIKGRLEKIGYYHNGNQGIINREVFKRTNTLNHEVLDVIAHHLYICPQDSDESKKHLLFRDYLRNNKFESLEYQQLKYIIADEAKNDRKKYAALKEVKAKIFIERIIALANGSKEFSLSDNL